MKKELQELVNMVDYTKGTIEELKLSLDNLQSDLASRELGVEDAYFLWLDQRRILKALTSERNRLYILRAQYNRKIK